MKKLLIAILCIIMTMSLITGCSSSSNSSKNTGKQTTQTEESSTTATSTKNNNTKTGSKILVVYFTRAENIGGTPDVDAVSSASINMKGSKAVGNMKIMADYIKSYTGADEFSIRTKKTYPKGYRDTTDQAKTEQNDDARPELSTHVSNMKDYDIIFLGYPNWWGGLPMAVKTFLEEYDFSGKTIIPFASHGGSGLGSGPSEIKDICKKVTLLDGFAVSHDDVSESKKEIENWVDGLSLNNKK